MKKHHNNLIHVLILLICLVSPLKAKTVEGISLPEQFSSLPEYSLTFPTGTKSHTTYGILRDHTGLMWISTANGIERYDGLSFKHYSLSRTELRHIRDGFQTTLYMDSEGTLYAFTERSIIFRYDPDTDEFERLVSLKLQPYLHCVKAMAAEGNILHLGTSSGFRIFDVAIDSVINVVNEQEDIHQIIPYTNGNYLYGSGTLVGTYDPSKQSADTLCALNQDVMALEYDEKRHIIWVGTNGAGLFVIDADHPDHYIRLKGTENSIITALEPLDDLYMLIGTDGDGLKICTIPESNADLSEQQPAYLLADDSPDTPYQFPLSVVKGILADGDHIWVSMDMGGLALMRSGGSLKRLINPYARNVSDNSVFGADFDKDGLLWVAFNNSLGCFDPREGEMKNIYMNHESRFLTVKHASDGTVWAGGYNTGLYHFDPVTGQREHITSIADQPVLDCIWSVKEDMHNDIWIGGLNFPLTRLHFTEDRTPGKLQRKYERIFYQPVNQVSDMLEINPDTMIVTTFDGFWVVNRTTGQADLKMHNDSIWSYTNSIGAVAVHDGHELWLATTGAGLVCYDLYTDKIDCYHLDHGLPSVELRGIEMLNDSLLCASTENNGIFVFDTKNRHYVTALSQSEFTGISQFIRSASAASDNGVLLFGTDQGAVLFNMDNINVESHPYKILVEGDYVSNGLIHLPASDRNIKIAFTTTDIYDQSMYRFEYRIKGLVDNWLKVDDSRRLRYMALPAGTYKLEVRAYDATNRFREAEVKVLVDREVYLRWYFILAYIVVVIALCFFAAVLAVNYIMQRNDVQPGEKCSRLSFANIFSIRQAKLNYHLMVRQSETDALTGLRNRYSGQKLVTNILARHQQGVLFVMDCDKFKHVNDTYGHIAGDELLTNIAHSMRKTFPNDINIRLGGDEFAIFLIGELKPEQVKANAERFFASVRNIRLSDAPTYVPAISIGAAFTPENNGHTTFEALYSIADKKLYESKKVSGCSLVI